MIVEGNELQVYDLVASYMPRDISALACILIW